MSKSTQAGREFVRYAVRIGALELLPGLRKLKNDRMSPYFFDSGKWTEGEALVKLTDAYAALIKDVGMDVVFGLAYKGISFSAVITYSLYVNHGIRVGYAHNRKEEKTHGEGGKLVGEVKHARTALVDDVITDGGTKNDAMSFLEEQKAIPVCLVIAFDRMETVRDGATLTAAQEFEQQHKIPVLAIANRDDLIEVLKDSGNDRMVKLVGDYQSQYGVR